VTAPALELVLPTDDDTRAMGRRLAPLLRAGDLVILSGDLGAGKTTFTQGLGEGLRVRGQVTSPTFVIARVHPSLVGGPALVHVDAYRLGGIEELDDLDLDTSLESAVTVVEWGEGVAEGLADTRLEVALSRGQGADGATAPAGEALGPVADTDPRTVRIKPVGQRWAGADLATALSPPAG
jgi:tRNA threonylcarbamoyladenosine biosynthesis protein TsaE